MYFLTPAIFSSLVAANVVNNDLDAELNEPFKRDISQGPQVPKDANDIEAFSNVVGATQTVEGADEHPTLDYSAIEKSALAAAAFAATVVPTDGAEASQAAEAAHAAFSAGSGLADVPHSWQTADQAAIESAAQNATEAGSQIAQVYNTQAASTEDAHPSDVSLTGEQNRNDVISSILSDAAAGAPSASDVAGASSVEQSGANSVEDVASSDASSVEGVALSGASPVEDVARSDASSVKTSAHSRSSDAKSTAHSAVTNATHTTKSSSTSKHSKHTNAAGKLSAGAAIGGVFFAALLL